MTAGLERMIQQQQMVQSPTYDAAIHQQTEQQQMDDNNGLQQPEREHDDDATSVTDGQQNIGAGVDQTYFVLKQAGELASRNPNTRMNRPSALLPMPSGAEMGSGGAINRPQQPQRSNRRGQQQQQSAQPQQQQYQHPTMMPSLLGAPANFYPSTSGMYLPIK